MQKAVIAKYARIILCALYLAAAALMQCSLFPHFRLYGAVPDLVLCAIAAVACYEEYPVTCVYAVGAGFLLDTLGNMPFTVSPLLFLITAAIAMAISNKLPRHKIVSALIAALAGVACSCAVTAAILVGKGANAAAVTVHTALPQALYGVIVFVPVYLLTKLHYRIFGVKNEKR